MSEEWRPVFNGLYAVSNRGRVKREAPAPGTRRGKLICIVIHKDTGYPMAVLRHQRKQYARTVHSLVAEAFIGPRPEGHQVNHKNFDRSDNRPENLEYVTPSGNTMHARRANRRRYSLTEKDIQEIRSKPAHESYASIARRLGVHRTTVERAARRKWWRHV